MPKMDVPKPVYDWLLHLKTDLSIAKGRSVTWPEVFEYVQAGYQSIEGRRAALLADVKASRQ